MADATKNKCLTLPCPCCGENQAGILFHLHHGDTFTCTECDGEFSSADVRELVNRWLPVLAWVESMPTVAHDGTPL